MAASSLVERTDAGSLIGGSYAMDTDINLADYGGGQPCFGVVEYAGGSRVSGRRERMAVQVHPSCPPRAKALAALSGAKIENLLLPLAHGRAAVRPGVQAWFVVTAKPLGPSVWPVSRQGEATAATASPQSITPWSETDLLVHLIRPVALILEQLGAAGLTHRAIRPNNVFHARAGHPVTLGGAWAAPPGSAQPAAFEPPYAAMCHRSGRGDGAIADDVYALGVLMLALASGRMPMDGLDDDAIIRRKLDRGSFAALAGDLRLSAAIADLARVMLAEDPDHRPPPLLLADPLAARARRVASRPPQRAPRKLDVGAQAVWESRGLAFALARAPEQAVRLLRGHSVSTWLRRVLSDPVVATGIEEAVRASEADTGLDGSRSDALLVMRAVAVLDPTAPLCWRGMMLFPDGIGAMTAADPSDLTMHRRIEAMIAAEAIGHWIDLRPEATAAALLRLDARQMRMTLRIAGWSGGMARLRYTLNPLLACRSPLVDSHCVVRLNDLLPALELVAAGSADIVIDEEIAGFVSARFNGRMDTDFTILGRPEDPAIDPPGHHGLAQLRVLTRLGELQSQYRWPNLAATALRSARAGLKRWRSRSVRHAREAALLAAVASGLLPDMLTVLQDAPGLAVDGDASIASDAEIVRIDQTLAVLAGQGGMRTAAARTTGQEIAAALGVMALAVSVILTVIG